MLGFFKWRDNGARASMLAGSISAAAFVFSLTSAGAGVETNSGPIGTPASEIGKPIIPHATGSAPHAQLRTIKQMMAFQAAHPMLGLRQAAHRPLIPMGWAAYLAEKQRASAAVGDKHASSATPGQFAAPTVRVLAAPGASESDSGNGFYPPDSTGAIGGSQIVAPVNLTFNVYDRHGTALLNVGFNAFLGTSEPLSDPRVIYDPIWKRWVVTIINIPGSTSDPGPCFWVAISTTGSATGSYYVYHPCVSGGSFANGDLWDYDIQGMSQDAVLLTGNIFACCFTSYKGAALIAMPKAKLYNGLGFSAPVPLFPTSVGTVTPPIVRDSNANAYFLAADSNHTQLDIYRGTNLSNEGQFSLALQSTPSASFSTPPSARQSASTQLLDTLDGRFQAPSSQYGNSLWNVHTTALGSFPAPQFFQIDTNANSILQQGTFFESSTSDDFNPSIAVNTGGEAFVTWSATDGVGSTPHNARVRYSGRQAGDTAGVIGAGSVLAYSGPPLTGNLQNGIQRWGDYSAAFLDSSAPAACSGASNRRAAIFNERIVDRNTWGIEFGIVGYC